MMFQLCWYITDFIFIFDRIARKVSVNQKFSNQKPQECQIVKFVYIKLHIVTALLIWIISILPVFCNKEI